MANVIRAKDTLGDLFHKIFRQHEALAPNVDEDVFYDLLVKHRIEIMPEDASPADFYEVGFVDGQGCLSNTERPYNMYVAYNKAEEEYVFIRAGNVRGAEGCIRAAGAELLKLVGGSRKRKAA